MRVRARELEDSMEERNLKLKCIFEWREFLVNRRSFKSSQRIQRRDFKKPMIGLKVEKILGTGPSEETSRSSRERKATLIPSKSFQNAHQNSRIHLLHSFIPSLASKTSVRMSSKQALTRTRASKERKKVRVRMQIFQASSQEGAS